MHRFTSLVTLFFTWFFAMAFSVAAAAQVPQSAQPAAASAPGVAASPVSPILSQLRQTAQNTTNDLTRLRIEHWKADNGTKQQAQQVQLSVSRNVSAALPEIMQAAQAQPASLAAQFKLYHNLTALYEALSSLTETTGAFGAKQDYDALAADLNHLDEQRHSLADYLQTLATQNDAELMRLRTQVARAATTSQPSEPAKKVIVDDAPSKPSAARKKTPAKKTTPAPASASGTSTPPPK